MVLSLPRELAHVGKVNRMAGKQTETKEPKKSVFETLNAMLFGKTNAKAAKAGSDLGDKLLNMHKKPK